MLTLNPPAVLTDLDPQVFALVVPPDLSLRQLAAAIDCECFRPRLAEAYSLDLGRPSLDPVRMLKRLCLRFHDP